MQKVNIFNVKFKKVYEKLERDIEGTSRKDKTLGSASMLQQKLKI